ncbi:cytochrome P460 family protein [Myxococcota bacterium]|jgi:hypothetical protein|nr:cytochrome P460 family protein [Myxococcota bacterium]
MRISPILGMVAVLGVAGCSGPQVQPEAAADKGPTSFPSSYADWVRLNQSPLMVEGARTARNLYANPTALSRERADGPFPLGSILVKEERTLVVDAQGQARPGEVFRVSVMFKVGQGQTSGWAFKAFDPATGREMPRDKVDPDGCYFCHADVAGQDYVFTRVGR